MKTIIHISDLHFGRENPAAVEGLLKAISAARPALIAISGDLTQRARIREYIEAREFLDRLPARYLVVPGNHDVPLYNLVRRFQNPLTDYKQHITSDLSPMYVDDELAVLGINTARSLTWKGGRISTAQMADIAERFKALPPDLFRVLVTHHQFIPPPGELLRRTVGRGSLALRYIQEAGIDLLLAGHLHLGYTGDIKMHYPEIGRSILTANAATAISTRVRGEGNGYNLIELAHPELAIASHVWDGIEFKKVRQADFTREGGEWKIRKAK